MSSVICPCCEDWKDRLLCLPCHREHKMCESCLRKMEGPIARSIRCIQCRKTYSWLNYQLLHRDGDNELPFEQCCATCIEKNMASRVGAKHYCLDCENSFCASCNEDHKRMIDESNMDHAVISFEQYRSKSQFYEKVVCTRSNHMNQEVQYVCLKCEKVACSKCIDSGGCSGQKDSENSGFGSMMFGYAWHHDLKPIDERAPKVLADIKNYHQLLKEKIADLDMSTKETQNNMETLRVACESIKEQIENPGDSPPHGISAEKLLMQKDQLLADLKTCLENSAKKVGDYLKGNNDLAMKLQTLLDGINVVTETSNAHLAEIKNKVCDLIREKVGLVKMPLVLALPFLHPQTSFCEVISLSIVTWPNKLTSSGRQPTPRTCSTVDVSESGAVSHGGIKYMSGKINDRGEDIKCFRSYSEHFDDVYMLRRFRGGTVKLESYHSKDPNKVLANFPIFYKREATSFAILNSFLILAGRQSREILIYNKKSGCILHKVSHSALRDPHGICTDGQEQVFVTDNIQGGIYTFNIKKPELITQIHAGLVRPSAAAFFRGLVFVVGWRTGELYVLTQNGDLLQTLSVHSGKAFDISVNSSGKMAIAYGPEGYYSYELGYD